MTDYRATIVVKQDPSGLVFVPFDHDEDPLRAKFIDAMLQHLQASGHVISHHAGVPAHSGEPAATLGSHALIHSGPLLQGTNP